MTVETNIESLKADTVLVQTMWEISKKIHDELKDRLEALGEPEKTVEICINRYYGRTMSLRIDLLNMSVLQTAQLLSGVLGIEPPPLKLRFRGSASEGQCEIPWDEWYLKAAVSEDDTVKVDLHLRQSCYINGRTLAWHVVVPSLPVPGYLMGVKETLENAEVREEEARTEKEAERKSEASKRAADTRRRNKTPKVEGPATQKPMLLGPKELSLCRDAQEDIETAQLEQESAAS